MKRAQEISQSVKSGGSPKPDTNASPHWVACTAGRKAAAGTDVEDLYNRVSVGTRVLYLGNTKYRIHGTNQPSPIASLVRLMQPDDTK